MRKKDRRLRSRPHAERRRDLKALNLLTEGQTKASATIQKKKPYKLGDGEWLKLRYDGFTKCFIVYLERRMGYGEIKERMKRGFGDLDGEEVRV